MQTLSHRDHYLPQRDTEQPGQLELPIEWNEDNFLSGQNSYEGASDPYAPQ